MSKHIKYLLIIIIGLLVGIVIYYLYYTYTKNSNIKDTNTINSSTITKEEYYNNMKSVMKNYYNSFFETINLTDEEKENGVKLRVKLRLLYYNGFAIDEFKSFEDDIACDLEYSFADFYKENDEYKAHVYYKCGDDANYDVESFIKNSNTTTTTKVN